MNAEQERQIVQLARSSVDRDDAIAKGRRHQLKVVILDGWVCRVERKWDGEVGRIIRERPASDVERALWGSLR
jgi:hypothetical protein